jgi:hypothetical protein
MDTIIGWIIIGVVFYFFIKKKKKKLTPEQIEAQNKKAAQEKALREKKAKDDLKKAQELVKIKKEKEKKILVELTNSDERVYFSYSFVSVKSDLYLINSLNNEIIESSKTCAEELYSQGYKIVDIDKTGKSAQLEAFNFVIRFSKIDKSKLKLSSKKRKKLPPPPPPLT